MQEGDVGFQAKLWGRHTRKVSLFKKYNGCEKVCTWRTGQEGQRTIYISNMWLHTS